MFGLNPPPQKKIIIDLKKNVRKNTSSWPPKLFAPPQHNVTESSPKRLRPGPFIYDAYIFMNTVSCKALKEDNLVNICRYI